MEKEINISEENHQKLLNHLKDMRDLVTDIKEGEYRGYEEVTIEFNKEKTVDGDGFPIKFYFRPDVLDGRDKRAIKKVFDVLYDRFRDYD